MTDFANLILSSLTVLAELLALTIIISILFYKKCDSAREIVRFFGRRAFWLSFLVALTATLGSLFYSEIAGYEPCKYCWIQRIFMYPLSIMFLIALVKKDGNVFRYTFPLTILGGLLAGYHYLLQRGIAPAVPCDALGYSVACSKIFVMNFGYITIPLMAFSAFLLIAVTKIAHEVSRA
jgi:disulfide bond formation protein DsbB